MKTSTIITVVIAAFVIITSIAFKPVPSGKELYTANCKRCHGEDGTKGLFGARNLREAELSDSAIVKQIRKGSGFMPSFRKKLNQEEMLQVMYYVKGLRKQ
ncbi:c-type cytochrome [Solitalea canadensis]|uniref:c-type cytochrome n=1 Tax=Solitalea canadensis TaxID=995 RepID=UPI00024746D7|nr:cytochrome c [Solitalea canadensis]